MKTTHGQTINALQPNQSVRLEKIEHGGSLEARRLSSGKVVLYWRHTDAGKTERVPIGSYDSSASPKSLKPNPRGYSILAAREAARELAKVNAETPGGLRASREREAAAIEAQRRAEAARANHTLQALCREYTNWLKARGKSSWRDADNIFSNHLLEPNPELADTPAAAVQKRQLIEPIRKLTEAGKQSTARKLRSYLRAAYACAVKADSDPTLPSAFIAFAVVANPIDGTAPIKGKADKRPLSIAELRRYWRALKEEDTLAGAALRLHLLSGAQRVAQLVRLRDTDVQADTFKLLDPKGRRDEPRTHLLPLTKEIRVELARLSNVGYVLSTDGGETAMHPTSLSAWASEIAARAGIRDFQLKRARSGVETALASLGVPLHARGLLQSHGLGGVQQRNYDDYEYLPEKRGALTALHGLLEQRDAKTVTPLKRRKVA